LLTLGIWWRCRTTCGSVAAVDARPKGGKRFRLKSGPIKRACAKNDPHQTAEALLEWAQARWPEQPPRSLGALAGRLEGPVVEQIRDLERVLYSPDAGAGWQGEALWGVWQAGRLDRDGKGEEKGSSGEIAPLYP
jgi:hypothetical protein